MLILLAGAERVKQYNRPNYWTFFQAGEGVIPIYFEWACAPQDFNPLTPFLPQKRNFPVSDFKTEEIDVMSVLR